MWRHLHPSRPMELKLKVKSETKSRAWIGHKFVDYKGYEFTVLQMHLRRYCD
jgi:hypothetical protein